MAKLTSVFLICVVRILCLTPVLLTQTLNPSSPDTSNRSAQKLTPKADAPRIQLPDVIIYGSDRSLRIAGEKLIQPQENVKLIAPPLNYHPSTNHLIAEWDKNLFHPDRAAAGSRTDLQLAAGTYQKLGATLGTWKETENYNYGLKADYERSNGQYDNSQYNQSQLLAQVGIRVAPNLAFSSKGNLHVMDYGLYGAQSKNLARSVRGGRLKINALWSSMSDQSTDLSLDYSQKSYRDRNNNFDHSNLNEKSLAFGCAWQKNHEKLPVLVQGQYQYDQIYQVDRDLLISQNYAQLRSGLSFNWKPYVTIKPCLQFEYLTINSSFSENGLSPELEIVVTPTSKLGLLLQASRGKVPMHFFYFWEQNYYLSLNVPFLPLKKEWDARLRIEYQPIPKITITTELGRQNWNGYGYWVYESNTGLFQLNRLKNVTLTRVTGQSKFILSNQIQCDVGIHINFDIVGADSSVTGNTHVPYLEKVNFPVHLEYEINRATQATVDLICIGPRYRSLKDHTKLASVALLSLQAERQLVNHISIFIKINNLFNQKYEPWDNYPAMGFSFETGLKGNW